MFPLEGIPAQEDMSNYIRHLQLMAHDTRTITACDNSRTHGLEFHFISRTSPVAEMKLKCSANLVLLPNR